MVSTDAFGEGIKTGTCFGGNSLTGDRTEGTTEGVAI